MEINIKNLIGKVEIHYHGNEPQEVVGLEDAISQILGNAVADISQVPSGENKECLLHDEITSALGLYKEKLQDYTQKCTPALADHSKYCNRIGLERDLDLLWGAFRALESFIQACKLCDGESKNYAPFQVSAYAHKHLPKLYGQKSHPCKCPPPNECEAKE